MIGHSELHRIVLRLRRSLIASLRLRANPNEEDDAKHPRNPSGNGVRHLSNIPPPGKLYCFCLFSDSRILCLPMDDIN